MTTADPELARTLLSIARAAADHGRTIEPALQLELAALALDARLDDAIRAEAKAILEIEAGAQ